MNSWASSRTELAGKCTESLEGELPDEQVGGLLVLPDLPQGHGSGAEPVGLLHAGGDWGSLSGDLLGDQLLSGDLLSSGFPCGLFCPCHLISMLWVVGSNVAAK